MQTVCGGEARRALELVGERAEVAIQDDARDGIQQHDVFFRDMVGPPHEDPAGLVEPGT